MFGDRILAFFLAILPILLVIAAAQLVERRFPVVRCGLRGVYLNTACLVLNTAISAVLLPVVALLLSPMVSRIGYGFIPLAADGWWFLPSLLLYVVVMDFGEFMFHLAQHRVPWMWAMHSLHHSDSEVSAATGVRVYWFETVLKGLTLGPAAAILFALNPAIAGWYALIRLLDLFQHINLRIGYGRLARWIVSPQYHRLHHSREPRHFDRNFAPYFAVWDLITGTQYLPRPDEYPPTGLDTGDEPVNIGEMLFWTARRHRRAARPVLPASPSSTTIAVALREYTPAK